MLIFMYLNNWGDCEFLSTLKHLMQLYCKDLSVDREGHNLELILKILQFQHWQANEYSLILIFKHLSMAMDT